MNRVSTRARTVRADERGSGTVLMAGLMSVLMMLSFAVMVIAGYLVAAHRAEAAADLTALSGATAITQGEDGCARAEDLARRNRAEILDCDRVGDQIDFVITVRVGVTVERAMPGLPRTVTATAHAGPD